MHNLVAKVCCLRNFSGPFFNKMIDSSVSITTAIISNEAIICVEMRIMLSISLSPSASQAFAIFCIWDPMFNFQHICFMAWFVEQEN